MKMGLWFAVSTNKARAKVGDRKGAVFHRGPLDAYATLQVGIVVFRLMFTFPDARSGPRPLRRDGCA